MPTPSAFQKPQYAASKGIIRNPGAILHGAPQDDNGQDFVKQIEKSSNVVDLSTIVHKKIGRAYTLSLSEKLACGDLLGGKAAEISAGDAPGGHHFRSGRKHYEGARRDAAFLWSQHFCGGNFEHFLHRCIALRRKNPGIPESSGIKKRTAFPGCTV